MLSKSRDLALFLTQPTVRTLRLLSCPPRLLPPSAHLISLERARAGSGSRQIAIPVITLDPHMIDTQGVGREAFQHENPQ
jgi:hypothetical protein